MIYSLRKWHRRAMLTLAVVLPTLLILGLMARPSFPRVSKLPDEPSQPGIRAKLHNLPGAELRVFFEKISNGKESGLLYLAPAREITEPDVLVYWDEQGTSDGVPGENAVLLGSLKGSQVRRLIVPKSVPDSSGFLLLYSNAHRKVISVSPWQEVASGGTK
ncbi:MAG: hypothetical protein ABI882_12600 [Acidobacteriota bacterium]